MRTLTLVRHAKSSWADEQLDDFHRPLNERGLRDAPLMAERFVHGLKETVSLVSSPATRAAATAEIFAQACRIAPARIRLEPAIYEASSADLLHVVRALDDADANVLLFGHNPGLSDFCHLLARCDFADMPTCAIARIDFDLDHWNLVGPGSGRLVAYSYPKERQ